MRWRERLRDEVLVRLIVAVGFTLTPLLLVVARTRYGRFVGGVALGVAGTTVTHLVKMIVLVCGGWVTPWDYAAYGFVAILVGSLVTGLVLIGTPPQVGTVAPSPVWSLAPFDKPPKFPSGACESRSLETDVIRLGVALVTRLDPRMSRAEAGAVRRVTARLLAEMDADPAYRYLPAVWFTAVCQAVWGHYACTHFYAYLPPTRGPGGRLGAVVFLHGHGPNSALYVHAWRGFCDRHGLALIAPSFGYGNWEHPDGVNGVLWVVLSYLDPAAFDPTRVYLAGLSQGGAGVGRAAAAMPDRFAGLIFLSPTTEFDVLGSPEFVDGWKGRPMLVAQGGRDHNVKPAAVTAAVELMRRNGADVTYYLDPAADHFLFFAKSDEMLQLIGGWMQASQPPVT